MYKVLAVKRVNKCSESKVTNFDILTIYSELPFLGSKGNFIQNAVIFENLVETQSFAPLLQEHTWNESDIKQKQQGKSSLSIRFLSVSFFK